MKNKALDTSVIYLQANRVLMLKAECISKYGETGDLNHMEASRNYEKAYQLLIEGAKLLDKMPKE